MSAVFEKHNVTLHHGDCLEVMAALKESGVQVDSIVTDPPYHLTSIVKRFGGENAAPAQHGTDGAYARAVRGFMGKKWDGGDIAFRRETWELALALLKPGGHLLAFSGTRTYHRMTVAIEDAGFEIRDQIGWLYGTGFPKSHDVSKGIDKAAGAEREVVGHSTSGIAGGTGEFTAGNKKTAGFKGEYDITAPATEAAKKWEGWGTALKPAWEPIVLARKPLIGTVVANVLEHGTGALNIDASRIEGRERQDYGLARAKRTQGNTYGKPSESADFDSSKDRFPPNVLHDGSDEVLAAFPDGAARFFYSSKAQDDDRCGSKHPTVKPTDLISWLCRLITPPGGLVLDMFAGSGSTGMACMREGFRAILIEREAEYIEDIKRRLLHVSGENTPLFGAKP